MGLKKAELIAKMKGIKYMPFEQDGKTYNLYDMPKGKEEIYAKTRAAFEAWLKQRGNESPGK